MRAFWYYMKLGDSSWLLVFDHSARAARLRGWNYGLLDGEFIDARTRLAEPAFSVFALSDEPHVVDAPPTGIGHYETWGEALELMQMEVQA